MVLKDSEQAWGSVSRALHWIMAVVLIGLLFVGFYMVEVETDLVARFKLTQIHKSFGFVAFVLGVLRIIWHLSQFMRPRLPDTMKTWETGAARLSHVVFYLLMLGLPLTGWLMASASPLNDVDAFPFRVPNMVFGLFELPDPFNPGNEATTKVLLNGHFWLGVALACLLLVHIGAALKHAFVDLDDVLRRMVRGNKS
jgi:cytochrome b561